VKRNKKELQRILKQKLNQKHFCDFQVDIHLVDGKF
jgi:hypothetical protein